jgi:hypothetical protein
MDVPMDMGIFQILVLMLGSAIMVEVVETSWQRIIWTVTQLILLVVLIIYTVW